MHIYVGADHGGYQLKETLKQNLQQHGHTVEDCGAQTFEKDDDYPQFAWAVADKVAQHSDSFGILLCRFGGGMTIAANKHKAIRAVMAHSAEAAKKAREDNNANILVLSADLVSESEAQELVQTFLTTSFSDEARHQRRLSQIAAYEEKI